MCGSRSHPRIPRIYSWEYVNVLNKLTKDTKYKVIEGYSIEYIGNRVYLMNISTYNRVKLTKNQMEEITSEYCKA